MSCENLRSRRRLLCGALGVGLLGASDTLLAQWNASDEYGDAALRGAGSTFVHPLIEAWVRQYRSDPFQVLGASGRQGGLDNTLSNDGLDYEAVGSLAGIERIKGGVVDFAATEMPLEPDTLQRSRLMQLPWVTGAVAVVTNVAGVAALQLDAAALAGIFLGRIVRWNDPVLAAQNPGARLPDQPITVMHRSDGSGTTFTFSQYLSRNDASWKEQVGSDLLLKWPVGKGHRGTDELVNAVKTTPNAIGYVNVVQARRAGLSVAVLRNSAGRHVAPDGKSIAAAFAARRAGEGARDALPIDSPGEGSYPLVATVFCLMPARQASARQRRTAEFVAWTLTQGAGIAQRLGYAPLPDQAAKATADRLMAKG